MSLQKQLKDHQAEDAIRQAFRESQLCNAVTIPDKARKILNDSQSGPERIHAAIAAMVARGDLSAPNDPHADWLIT